MQPFAYTAFYRGEYFFVPSINALNTKLGA